MRFRRPVLPLSLAAALLFGGCLTISGGFTERQWNEAIAALEPGLTQAELLAMIGEPRERRPAAPAEDILETWIYSRPEKDGTRTRLVGEHDILLPNGKDIQTVPDYEDQDITVIAEYHLRWRNDVLDSWDRQVDRLPGH